MNRYVIVGLVGVAVIAIALGLIYWQTADEGALDVPPVASAPTPAPEPAPAPVPAPQPEAASPETPAPPPQVTQPAPEPEASPEAPQIATAPPTEPAPVPVIKPEFDIVRVTPTGDAVIAGRAAPGAVVTVYDGGRPIGDVKADSRGEWVLVPDEPLPPGSRELGLSSRLGGGDIVWSDSVVVVVVPEPGVDIAGRATEKPSDPLVVEVPRTSFGPSTVLQKPPVESAAQPVPEGPAALVVDVLDYDSAGNLSLTGRSGAGSDIRVYLDNGFLGNAPASDKGAWGLTVERTIAPGLYTLRVDEVAGKKVVARLEFPFARADPREIEAGALLVVVQPGNSLWRLARRTLGEGVRYTVIYEANRERIRDPDLIYPGQIFEVPRTN